MECKPLTSNSVHEIMTSVNSAEANLLTPTIMSLTVAKAWPLIHQILFGVRDLRKIIDSQNSRQEQEAKWLREFSTSMIGHNWACPVHRGGFPCECKDHLATIAKLLEGDQNGC